MQYGIIAYPILYIAADGSALPGLYLSGQGFGLELKFILVQKLAEGFLLTMARG
jgi:hypothetical protein